MKLLLIIASILILTINVSAKEVPICILGKNLHDFGVTKIGEWMCSIEKESNLYTDMLVYNNGTLGYGLFQIPDTYCTYGKAEKTCNKDCRDFLNSDYSDDYQCMLKVIENSGYSIWKSWDYCNQHPYTYKNHCISFD